MTREGDKHSRSDTTSDPVPHFACLRPLLENEGRDAAESFQAMAAALHSYDGPCRIQIRLVDGDETIETWEVEGGARASAARAQGASDADVVVVVSSDTWLEIARGRLAPFEALFGGRLRVGGNVELAKRIARHLTDPGATFVAPC
jgi:hypothetical protein